MKVKRRDLTKLWVDNELSNFDISDNHVRGINKIYSAGFRAGAKEAVMHSHARSVQEFNLAVDFLIWLESGRDLEIYEA